LTKLLYQGVQVQLIFFIEAIHFTHCSLTSRSSSHSIVEHRSERIFRVRCLFILYGSGVEEE